MSMLCALALASSPVAALPATAMFIPAGQQQEVTEKRRTPKRETRPQKKDAERAAPVRKTSDWCTSDGMTVRCDLFRDSNALPF